MLNLVDFDDTLILTGPPRRRAWNESIEYVTGFEEMITKHMWDNNVYNPMSILFNRKGIPKTEQEEIYQRILEVFPKDFYDEFKMNRDLMKILASSPVVPWNKNIICSNSNERDIQLILEYFLLTHQFDFICGADTFIDTIRKPSSDMHWRIHDMFSENLLHDSRITVYDDSPEGLKAAYTFKKEAKEQYNIIVDVVEIKM